MGFLPGIEKYSSGPPSMQPAKDGVRFTVFQIQNPKVTLFTPSFRSRRLISSTLKFVEKVFERQSFSIPMQCSIKNSFLSIQDQMAMYIDVSLFTFAIRSTKE